MNSPSLCFGNRKNGQKWGMANLGHFLRVIRSLFRGFVWVSWPDDNLQCGGRPNSSNWIIEISISSEGCKSISHLVSISYSASFAFFVEIMPFLWWNRTEYQNEGSDWLRVFFFLHKSTLLLVHDSGSIWVSNAVAIPLIHSSRISTKSTILAAASMPNTSIISAESGTPILRCCPICKQSKTLDHFVAISSICRTMNCDTCRQKQRYNYFGQ